MARRVRVQARVVRGDQRATEKDEELIRFLAAWLFRVAVVAAMAFALVYVGDWAVYRMRGAPQSKVTVNQYLAIPLKGRKTEYDYQGTFDQPCAVALFAQGSLTPCWRLRRNPNQGITM